MQAFQEHDWPGNVRELRNVLARCVAICDGRPITCDDLPLSVLEAPSRILSQAHNPVHPIIAATFHHSSSGAAQGAGRAGPDHRGPGDAQQQSAPRGGRVGD